MYVIRKGIFRFLPRSILHGVVVAEYNSCPRGYVPEGYNITYLSMGSFRNYGAVENICLCPSVSSRNIMGTP